jgi:hypothetical protein
MEEKKDTFVLAPDGNPENKAMLQEGNGVTLDAINEDPLEDLGIDFLLEEVENKIAPLALA